jgi:hypothetical protein
MVADCGVVCIAGLNAFTATVLVVVQPVEKVPVTVYTEAESTETVACGPVAPMLQEYDAVPDAARVVVPPPAHTRLGLEVALKLVLHCSTIGVTVLEIRLLLDA